MLKLGINNLSLIKWYVDGSYNIHWDSSRHGGALLIFGEGVVSSYSRKAKLSTKSSMETKMIVIDMYMPEMLWSLYFIQHQGYGIASIGLHQDNSSTQLLMKNGRFSSGKKTKHIKAKFFYIKDRVDNGEMKIIYWPIKWMCADILTKSLQGKAFQVIRAKLMNSNENYQDDEAEEARGTSMGTKTG